MRTLPLLALAVLVGCASPEPPPATIRQEISTPPHPETGVQETVTIEVGNPELYVNPRTNAVDVLSCAMPRQLYNAELWVFRFHPNDIIWEACTLEGITATGEWSFIGTIQYWDADQFALTTGKGVYKAVRAVKVR